MKTRPCQAFALTAVALLAACGDSAPTSPFQGQLTTADMAGSWYIAFQVDSVRDCSSGTCRMARQFLLPPVVGSLVISDRYDTLYSEYLTAELQVDFQPALGRQVTCLSSPQGSLVQPRDSGAAYFWFTPGAADCGLGAVGQFDGQQFNGRWGEASFTDLPLSSGTFRMWRTN
jgi:hypothetical protein